jgi:hypothetical protein
MIYFKISRSILFIVYAIVHKIPAILNVEQSYLNVLLEL